MKYAPIGIGLSLAVAGCASSPVNLYTLIPSPPSSTARDQDVFAVQLPPARLPAQVDRSEIVVRIRGYRVTLLENEHWASSLGDEISRAVSLEFSAGVSKSDPQFRQLVTDLVLSIDVHQFDAMMKEQTTLTATWGAEIRQRNSLIKLACFFSTSRSIGSGVSAVILGYQEEVAALGDAMARGVLMSVYRQRAACPEHD